MRVKKQMQLLGMLNPAETPELEAAVKAIGNANTREEISDILSDFTVKFLKTLAHYESIWDINGLRKSGLVSKIASVISYRFDCIDGREICRDYSPADKIYLMRTQGITPDYIWDFNNWAKDTPDGQACTYILPNNDSQPKNTENPATADDTTSASDNHNALASQPASVASTQSDTTDKPEIIKFEVGKTYKSVFSQSGYHFRYKFTVIDRHEKYITVRNENNGESARRTLHIDDNGVEWVNPRGTYASQKRHVLFADAPTVEPEITAHAEISQPESLYMDDSFSEAPGDNSCPDQDIPGDYNPLHIVQTWYGHSRSDAEMLRIDRKCEATHYNGFFIFAQFMPSMSVQFCLAKSEKHAINMAIRLCKDFRIHCNDSDIRVEKLCNYFPDWTDFLPRYMDDSLSTRVFRDFHYDPLHFFRDKGIHERKNDNPPYNPGFTVVPSEHITRPNYSVYPEPIIDECPYTTVYACETPTLNTTAVNPLFSVNFFFAHCLFLFKLFCASLHSNLIPYMLRDPFTEFYPSHVKDFYPSKNHFPAPFLLPCPRCGSLEKPVFAHRFYFDNVTKNLVEMLIVNCPHCGYTENSTIFSAKQDHSYSCYWGNDTKAAITLAENWNSCGLRERHKRLEAIHICPPRSKYFNHARKLNKMKLDACSDFQSLFSLILTLRAEEILSQATYMRFKLTPSDNAEALARELAHAIIQRREKSTPVHAEINDITQTPEPQPKTRKPESATDIEHKLIETKDLHFQERRAALDHNAAVISSCMFHEAIISMLLKISPAAIFQLGRHMDLFIARPKGKKIAIAELFAKRLIERRELRAKKAARVHTSNTQHTSINASSIPDNVKFFETKHGQLAFMFTDDLVFSD